MLNKPNIGRIVSRTHKKNVRQQQDGLIVKLHNATKGIDDSLPLMRVHLAKALQAATARHWQTTSNDQDHHIRHAFAAESYSQNNEPALIEIAHYVGKAVTESVRRAMNDPTINLLTERKAVCREYWKAVALTAPSLQSFDALKQGTLLETLRTPSKYELTPIRHACLWTQIESDIVGKQMAHTIMPEGVAVIPEIFMGSENRYLGINPPPAITYGR